MRYALVAAVLGTGVAVGCSSDPTQLVVVVGSDLSVPQPLQSVHARVTSQSASGSQWDHTFPLVPSGTAMMSGQFALPFSFGVVPHGGDASDRVIIELEAQGQTTLFSRTANCGFVEHATLLLPMFLSSSCLGSQCADGLTCTERGCVSATIDEHMLMHIAPGQEASFMFDAGVSDASVPPDAADAQPGSDALTLDSEPDAQVQADAGRDAGVDASIDAGVDASIDAGVDASVDAGVDATVDAGMDATVDAGADATVDAGMDASAPDASPPDAAPDAAADDATALDAASPDATPSDALAPDAVNMDASAPDATLTDAQPDAQPLDASADASTPDADLDASSPDT
jgi:hypothetical protein